MRLSKLNFALTIAACFVTPCVVPSPSGSSIGQNSANETTCMIHDLPFSDLNICPLDEEVAKAIEYMHQTNKPRTTSHPTTWFSKVPRFQFIETVLLPTTWLSKNSCFHFCKNLHYVLQVSQVLSSLTKEQAAPTPIFPATTFALSKTIRQPMIRSTGTNYRTYTLPTMTMHVTSALHPPMMHWLSADLVVEYVRDYVNALSAASRVQVEKAHDVLQYVLHQTRNVVTSYGSFATPIFSTAASTYVPAAFGKTLLLNSSKIVDLLKPALYNHGVVSLAHPAGVVVDSSAAFINVAFQTNATPLNNFTSLKSVSLTSDLVVDDSVMVPVSLLLLHPPSHGNIFASDPVMGERFWNRTLFIFDLAVVDQAKDLLTRRVSTHGVVSGIRHMLGQLRDTSAQLYCGLPWTLHLPTSRLAIALKRLRALAVLPSGNKLGIATGTSPNRLFSVKPNVVVIDSPYAFISVAAPINTTPLSNFTSFNYALLVVEDAVTVPVTLLLMQPPLHGTTSASDAVMSWKLGNRTLFYFDLATIDRAKDLLAQVRTERVLNGIRDVVDGVQYWLIQLRNTYARYCSLPWTAINLPTAHLVLAFNKSRAFVVLPSCKSIIAASNRLPSVQPSVVVVDSPSTSTSAAAPTNTTPWNHTVVEFAQASDYANTMSSIVSWPLKNRFLYLESIVSDR